MERGLGVVVAVALAGAVAQGCRGGSSGAPAATGGAGTGATCPAGQACAASCSGTSCGGACCTGTDVCLAPGQCGSAGQACTSDATCTGGTACLAGTCQKADGTCSYHPPKGPFTPRVAWQWTGSPDRPELTDVLMTPVVVPLQPAGSDASVPPAVVFNAIRNDQGAGSVVPGVMRAVNGRDGTDLWSSDPAHPVNGLAAIAAGDLLGTGHQVFVTARLGSTWPSTDPTHRGPPTDDGLVAFDDAGRFLWEVKGLRVFWGAPSMANLYGGAEAQVVLGATVVDAHGTVLCQGTAGQGDNFLGPISTVADVDLDGSPDIVTGSTVYDAHCQPKPGWPNGQPDGLVAVANFTGDAHPEIVVVSAGTVRLQDWQGRVLWGPVAIPGGGAGGGAPTVADFDADGQLEIGVAGRSSYTVFKPFAANPVLWSRPTQDESMVTGSSVFDFTHEGRPSVVYGDECYTRVYDGTDGTTLFESPNPSCTVHENPVIADVDRDGRAEIVVATNSVCNIQCPWGGHVGSGRHGITVFKDLRDHWVSTRSIWNQHAYHVTNVGDDGSIPRAEQANWTASWFGSPLNDFRANPIGNADFRAPDLAVASADLAVDGGGCPGRLRLKVNVWNRGAVLVTGGVPVAVYAGKVGGAPLVVGRTAGAIMPGSSELVTLDVAPAPSSPTDLVVAVNDDGTGQGVVGECRVDNDVVKASQVYCASASR